MAFNYNQKLNHSQKVFTKAQWMLLKANSEDRNENKDPKPVVKLFNPRGAATWLLTECDENGYAFGLCDLGMGFPELGYVSIPELIDIGFIERDLHFSGAKPISEYAEEASREGHIVAC